jgi:hypothetical protein
LVQAVALELVGIRRNAHRQVVGHDGKRLAVRAAQPVDGHHLAVVFQAELARDLLVGRTDVVVEQLSRRLLTCPREVVVKAR